MERARARMLHAIFARYEGGFYYELRGEISRGLIKIAESLAKMREVRGEGGNVFVEGAVLWEYLFFCNCVQARY